MLSAGLVSLSPLQATWDAEVDSVYRKVKAVTKNGVHSTTFGDETQFGRGMASYGHASIPLSREVVERRRKQIEAEQQNPGLWAAYRKWHHEESEWGQAARDLIVEWARLERGMNVLDLASEHGEPPRSPLPRS
jgi:hypothetical protein